MDEKMDEKKQMTDDDTLATRWRPFMPYGVPPERALSTARLLAAQSNYFSRLDEVLTEPLEEIAGPDWREVLLRGLGHAFATHPIHELFAVQPISSPIWPLHRLTKADREGDDLTWNRRVIVEAISTESARLKVRLHSLPDTGIWGGLHVPIADFVFEEAINEVMHAVLAKCIEAAGTTVSVRSFGREDVREAQQHVYGNCAQTPKILVAHDEHALDLRTLATPVQFPLFPKDKALLLHRSMSGIFGSVVWLPFVFQFFPADHPEAEDKTEDKTETESPGDSFERYPNGLVMSIRHKAVITNPETVVVLKLPEPELRGDV